MKNAATTCPCCRKAPVAYRFIQRHAPNKPVLTCEVCRPGNKTGAPTQQDYSCRFYVVTYLGEPK